MVFVPTETIKINEMWVNIAYRGLVWIGIEHTMNSNRVYPTQLGIFRSFIGTE